MQGSREAGKQGSREAGKQGKAPRACGHYIVAIASITITGNMGNITGNSSF